jgi:hypothetical protein
MKSHQHVEYITETGSIPGKDTENIGFPARRYLQSGDDHFVLLIDDLEWDWHEQAQAVFNRYRDALHSVLPTEVRSRTAVHFLAMMMEAYFFGDRQAVNAVLGLDLQDYEGDVEQIRHPKDKIKELCATCREVEHGAEILGKLRVEYILSCAKTCAYPRALFAWCVTKLNVHPNLGSVQMSAYCLDTDVVASATSNQ